MTILFLYHPFTPYTSILLQLFHFQESIRTMKTHTLCLQVQSRQNTNKLCAKLTLSQCIHVVLSCPHLHFISFLFVVLSRISLRPLKIIPQHLYSYSREKNCLQLWRCKPLQDCKFLSFTEVYEYSLIHHVTNTPRDIFA